MLTHAYIPYKGYYSTPFARWQGTLANENAIELGARTARAWLSARDISPGTFDFLILGLTVGQPAMFYGGPWASAMMGAEHLGGFLISQA